MRNEYMDFIVILGAALLWVGFMMLLGIIQPR